MSNKIKSSANILMQHKESYKEIVKSKRLNPEQFKYIEKTISDLSEINKKLACHKVDTQKEMDDLKHVLHFGVKLKGLFKNLLFEDNIKKDGITVFNANGNKSHINKNLTPDRHLLDPVREKIGRNIFAGMGTKQKKQHYIDKLNKLKNNPKADPQEIDNVQFKLDKLLDNEKKAAKTRSEMETVGGSEVTLITKDHVTLNGVFLDGEKFRKNLRAAGGKRVTCSSSKSDVNRIEGIAFPWDSSKGTDLKKGSSEFLSALESLKAFSSNPTGQNAGWVPVFTSDHVIFMSQEDVFKEEGKGIVLSKSNEHLILNKQYDSFSTKEIEDKPTSFHSTVIITSGNAGVYEMHKQEAMSFLLQGMNVLLFNFRGYGESNGMPSEQGCLEDYETAYRFVKERTINEDGQILFKALCMSGGVASEIGARHPKVNMFLDQTYSSFQGLSKEQIENSIKDIHRFVNFVSPAIGKIGSFATPTWQVGSSLAKNEGKKLFLYTNNDNLINNDQDIPNISTQLKKADKLDSLTLVRVPGTHGENWVDITSSALTDTNEYKNITELNKDFDEITKHYEELSNKLFDKLVEDIYDENNLRIADAEKYEKAYEKETKELGLELDQKLQPIKEKIEKITYQYNKEAENNTYIARNTVNQFLSKSNLSSPVLGEKEKPLSFYEEEKKLQNALINETETLKKQIFSFEKGQGYQLQNIEKDEEFYYFHYTKDGQVISELNTTTDVNLLLSNYQGYTSLKERHTEFALKYPDHYIRSFENHKLENSLRPLISKITHAKENEPVLIKF